METHTPGPWRYGGEYGPVGEAGRIVQCGTGYVICGLNTRSPQREANARLIAATPELLEQLQECCNLLREVYGMLNPEQIGNETLDDWLKKPLAAIACAEGRE